MSAMPSHLFCSVDDVGVSPRALALADEFARFAKASDPSKAWVVCFDWGDVRRRRSAHDPAEWEDLGAGLDLVAFETFQVPAEVVQTIGGFDFALKVPRHALETADRREIDVVSEGGTSLVLR